MNHSSLLASWSRSSDCCWEIPIPIYPTIQPSPLVVSVSRVRKKPWNDGSVLAELVHLAALSSFPSLADAYSSQLGSWIVLAVSIVILKHPWVLAVSQINAVMKNKNLIMLIYILWSNNTLNQKKLHRSKSYLMFGRSLQSAPGVLGMCFSRASLSGSTCLEIWSTKFGRNFLVLSFHL